MTRKAVRRLLLAGGASIAMTLATPALAQQRTFDVPAQSATRSIPEFARQAGIQIIAPGSRLRGLQTRALTGQHDVRAALAILLEGTGLRIVSDEGSTITLGLTGAQNPAGEAVAASAAADSESADQEIVVTGTNLRRRREEGVSNYIEIDREQIERSGQPTIARYLSTLPQNFGGAGETGTTAGLLTPNLSAGAAVSLRGLGAGSTLTLINGRRLPTASGSLAFFSDISAIPVSAVERIEVLPDSASAIYGADAVAGVVNIILRDDFEGIEATFSGGLATRGGYADGRASLVGGDNWSSGRLFFAIEHYRQSELTASEREFSRSNDLTRFGGSDLRSAISSPGNVIDVTGAGLPGLTQTIPGIPFPVPVFAVAIPHGQDGRNLTLADFQAQVGQPLNVSDLAPYSGLLPAQETTTFTGSFEQSLSASVRFSADVLLGHRQTRARGGIYAFQAFVPETNPFNPFGVPVLVQTFLPELGPLQIEQTINTASAVIGLEANLGRWRIRGAAGYGVDETKRREYNSVDEITLSELLSRTEPTEAFNVFGADGNASDLIEAIRTVSADRLRSTLSSASIIADGDLLQLPGGAVQAAVGGEYRRETFNAEGLDLHRDARAAFAEVRIPIFGRPNGQAGMRRLELSGAMRFDSYSDVGNETTPMIGIVWEPLSGLVARGSYSRAFRAPNLYEAAPPQGRVFVPLADPLRGGEITTVEILQGVRDDLRPERAETWSAGILWRPTFVSGVQIGISYFHTDYVDRITQPDFAALLTDPTTYSDYQRRAEATPEDIAAGFPGRLELVDLRSVNAAATKIEGLDLQASWALATDWGNWNFDFNGTYNTKYYQTLIAGAPRTDRLATLGYPVKYRLRGGLSWSRGELSLSGYVNYTDGYEDTNLGPHTRVNAYTTADVSFHWQPASGTLAGIRFQIAATNLFDADPPFVNQTSGYDANVADPRGRMVRLTVSRQF